MNMEAFSKLNPEVFSYCKTEFGKFMECCKDLYSMEKILEGYKLVDSI